MTGTEANRVPAGSRMLKHDLEALDLAVKNPLIISTFMGILPGSRMIPGCEQRAEKSDYYEHFDQWRRYAVARKPIKVISDGTKTNEERLGALGDLAFFFRREEIRSAVLVIGGDNFFAGGFEQLINEFSKRKKPLVMVHRDESLQRIAGRLGAVDVDHIGRIIGFEEKPQHPKSPLASTLCYLFTPEEVKLLKAYTREKSQLDNPGEFIRYMVENNCALYAFECESNWYDIGSPEEYKCANDAAQTLR